MPSHRLTRCLYPVMASRAEFSTRTFPLVPLRFRHGHPLGRLAIPPFKVQGSWTQLPRTHSQLPNMPCLYRRTSPPSRDGDARIPLGECDPFSIWSRLALLAIQFSKVRTSGPTNGHPVGQCSACTVTPVRASRMSSDDLDRTSERLPVPPAVGRRNIQLVVTTYVGLRKGRVAVRGMHYCTSRPTLSLWVAQ
jgi:hypothetical protein